MPIVTLFVCGFWLCSAIYEHSNVAALVPDGFHLLGDAGYRGMDAVLANRTRRELLFNPELGRRIAQDRVVIEQSFGFMKRRFTVTTKISRHRDNNLIALSTFVSGLLLNRLFRIRYLDA